MRHRDPEEEDLPATEAQDAWRVLGEWMRRLAASIGKDRKGLASVLIYLAAMPLAFVWPKAAYGCYIFVSVMWLLFQSPLIPSIGSYCTAPNSTRINLKYDCAAHCINLKPGVWQLGSQ